MVGAPVVGLPIALFGLWGIQWWDHVSPFVFFANGLCCLISCPVIVAVCIALVVTLLSWFLEGLGDFLDLTGQCNQALLVCIWFSPGSSIKHVCILAGSHLHELVHHEVGSTIIGIVMVAFDPYDECFISHCFIPLKQVSAAMLVMPCACSSQCLPLAYKLKA